MNPRFVLTVIACVALIPSTFYAQAKPTTPATAPAAPAAAGTPAKWVPPQKGEVTVDFIQGKPAIVKGEIVTKLRVKNTSKGSIALLAVEEIWYNTKREIATSGTARNKALLNPGDIVELTISSPNKPNLYTNMLMFKHANGTVKPNKVTKF